MSHLRRCRVARAVPSTRLRGHLLGYFWPHESITLCCHCLQLWQREVSVSCWRQNSSGCVEEGRRKWGRRDPDHVLLTALIPRLIKQLIKLSLRSRQNNSLRAHCIFPICFKKTKINSSSSLPWILLTSYSTDLLDVTGAALSGDRGSWQRRFPSFRGIIQKRLGKCTEIGMAARFGSILNRGNFSVIVEEGDYGEEFHWKKMLESHENKQKIRFFLKFHEYLKKKCKLSLFLVGMGAVKTMWKRRET